MARRPPQNRPPKPKHKSEVNCVIKYLVFGFNVFFWLIGALIIGVGIWAWTEKGTFDNFGELTGTKWLDPVLLIIIIGVIVFLIGFFGCIGALRENTILLLLFVIAIGIILLVEIALGVLLFAFKDWLKDQISTQLQVIITVYRDDTDLQNLIDWVQKDWLQCCGITGYNDWDSNVYFNCSSPSVERCGVPFSCCKDDPTTALVNTQCGYDTRDPLLTPQPENKIFTTGCVDAGDTWLNSNLIPVAGVAVGIALLQILGICFAWNLRSDIFAQMSKWQ